MGKFPPKKTQPQTKEIPNWRQRLAPMFVYFLHKRILSDKDTLEYFYKLLLKAVLRKPCERRSKGSAICLWLDTKAGFNDNFTNPSWIYKLLILAIK